MPVFLPTIIQQMGHSPTTAQAMSAPPFLIAFLVVIAAAHHSDKHAARARYIIVFALLASTSYITILIVGLLGGPSWIRYLALYPAISGFFTCITLILTWTLNNQESESGKGTGIALLQFLGQCGPLLGTRLFPADDGPLYSFGMGLCAAFMAGVAVLAFTLGRLLVRENERRLRMVKIEVGDGQGMMEEEDGKVRRGVFLFIV